MAAGKWLLRAAVMSGPVMLAACGGGGVNSTPAPPTATVDPTPVPTPTPTPTPAPVTTATSGNDTTEYRATVGAVSMNALSAYNAGATGKGVGLAIIDTGIDLQSAEFDNRISASSAPVGGETTVDDQGGHGTAVAFTAAGRRNGVNTQGVAFEATVIALRADRTGSCASTSTDDSTSGCKFGTDAIAAGVDAARVAGARVINMSLGGSTMPANLQAAIGRATAAGIVVVIAAGNDGSDNPDPFTNVSGTSDAHGAVIVAGSVGTTGTISSFSDKAGTGAATYLTAVGERVRAPDNTNTPYFWSGTSFAAPQISGAVALLAQAFPNLTGAQIVNLLLTTARDAGAVGTDAIYGHGILDLTRAFQPVGTTSIAGEAAAKVATTGGNGATSTPMGDASPMGVGAVILDGYGRAFAIDLAATIARHTPSRTLAASLQARNRSVAMTSGGTAVAMTLAPAAAGGVLIEPNRLTFADADAARAVAATVTQRLGRRTSFALGVRQGADGLSAQLAGRAEPAFLVATTGGLGFDAAARSAAGVRREVGSWGLTATVETGDVLTSGERLLPGLAPWRRTPYSTAALSIDRRVGPIAATLTGMRLTERDTLLGARLGAALGSPGATSWFATAAARVEPGAGWTLGGSIKRGWTTPQVHGFDGGGRLVTTAFAADVGKAGLFGRDGLGLRVAQPLRVGGGGVDLTLPTGWDYDTQAVSAWTSQRLGLTPTGRELDVEARYARPFAGGAAQTNLFWRRDPGNWATLPPDVGAALRWSLGF